MKAWNGVSAPAVSAAPPDEGDATRLGKAPDLHDARADGEEEAGAEEEADDPRHEQTVGGRLDCRG